VRPSACRRDGRVETLTCANYGGDMQLQGHSTQKRRNKRGKMVKKGDRFKRCFLRIEKRNNYGKSQTASKSKIVRDENQKG